jgi:hypothetical protein
MALAGSEERAGCEGLASVSAIHAPFTTEVECEMASVITRAQSRVAKNQHTAAFYPPNCGPS